MAKEGSMKIFVGQPRPTEALLGRVENDNATIKGMAEPCNAIGGMQIIANRSIVWGIRLNKDGTRPKERLQPNDKNYNGKVDFNVKWGTEGGMPITTRYKSGSPSIDYDYQVLQMGMKKFEEDVEENYLHLPFGEYVIFDSEEAKQLMLSTHHENNDSICRDPNASNFGSLRMVKKFESSKEQIKSIDKEFLAVSIVRGALSFEDCLVLRTLVGDKKEITYNEADETSLYENLLLYAKKNAEDFLTCMKTYDVHVSDIIEKYRSYKAFDWTKNGTLMFGQDKKEVLLDGIDAKGEDMVQYLFDNRMKSEVNDAINRMTVNANKLK